MFPNNPLITFFALCGAFMLAGCGSGGNAGGDGDTDTPPVTPGDNPDNSTPLVAIGATVDGQVAENDFSVYQVPPGSEVVLTTTSGNAELFLYSDPALGIDDLTCRSQRPFAENICAAGTNSAASYALVFGRQTSSYQLGTTNDCSVGAINEWVNRNMRDYYLFSDQVATVNPRDYDSPQALIQDLRVAALDPFSSVQNAAVQSSLFDEGNAFNLGYRWSRDTNGVARFARIYENSPMGLAGIERSDIIVSVNGVLWDELTGDRFREFIGTTDNPLPATWTYIDADTGETNSVQLTQSEYPVNSVTQFSVLPAANYPGKIGYLAFETFLNTSAEELDEAMAFFSDEGVTDLILDMRYNGGGRTFIARKLASQIAGPGTDNQRLIEYQHNSRYTSENFSLNFESEAINLGLNRVVVLTTSSTASASEIVINSLKPYIEVVTIGSPTQGKPYISSALTYCGTSLNAMHAEGVNANQTGVFGGIDVDCSGTDDLTRDYGFSSERGLEGFAQTATNYLVNGTCNAPETTLSKASVNDSLGDKQETAEFPGADGS